MIWALQNKRNLPTVVIVTIPVMLDVQLSFLECIVNFVSLDISSAGMKHCH